MILLDTHAWIWWVTADAQLSARARRAIEGADARGVSPLSCYEVTRLVARGRVRFDRDPAVWIDAALAQPGVVVVELTPHAAVAAGLLADFHGDPIDRMIAATAIELEVPLVTKDGRIRACQAVRTIW